MLRWVLAGSILIAVLGFILFSLHRERKASEAPVLKMERVSFQTEDNVLIVGDLYPVREGKEALLLLHMMPATRESWREFAAKAQAQGFVVLAIDLRGHGESTKKNGEVLNYQKFTDGQHQASIKDVEAAATFLASRGLQFVALGGASIGANLALEYASTYPEITKTFLLSPGFDYRGIETQPPASKLKGAQGVYFVGGSQDMRGSGQDAGQMAQTLYQLASVEDKEVEILETRAHGTDLFRQDPKLAEKLLGWLQK